MKTKKVNVTIPLKNGKTHDVKGGFEFILETGHVAVAHKTLKGEGWSVSLKESGLLVVKGIPTKEEAIQQAVERTNRIGKERIDSQIQK